MKKLLIFISFAVIVSLLFGKYIFSYYKDNNEGKKVSNAVEEKVYFIQQGAYSSEENAIINSKDLNFYIVEKEDNYYKVYVGITQSTEFSNKIKGIYNEMNKSIYIKEKDISNLAFLEVLKQYDNLLKDKTTNEEILSIEKQVLSKYKELVIQNGEGTD
jgi:hypothetical protein